MKIIKLNAIDSTNSYLINLSKKEILKDATIIVTTNQKKGRGQLGLHWLSTPHQSLTFSVFKRFDKLSIQRISYITFAVSIAINNVLKKLSVPGVTIKWPNDIMSYSNKIAGILIENQIKHGTVISSVIGVGLNVNEENFENLDQATSILLSTGRKHQLDEVLSMVSEEIIKNLDLFVLGDFQKLKTVYEASLFRKDWVSVFKEINGKHFNGIIRGVTDTGALIVENEDEIRTTYQLKEIKYLL